MQQLCGRYMQQALRCVWCGPSPVFLASAGSLLPFSAEPVLSVNRRHGAFQGVIESSPQLGTLKWELLQYELKKTPVLILEVVAASHVVHPLFNAARAPR